MADTSQTAVQACADALNAVTNALTDSDPGRSAVLWRQVQRSLQQAHETAMFAARTAGRPPARDLANVQAQVQAIADALVAKDLLTTDELAIGDVQPSI